MATNEYQTFGDSGTDGVNKLSLNDYIADKDRVYGNGFTNKVVRSQLHNKALQQTSKMSAALAQFLVINNISALDTDSVATISNNIVLAVGKSVASVLSDISSVTDLASVPSSYTIAIVNDLNRGGTFIWSPTGTANGGTVFAGATGYWNRQYSGALNVKWFGVKGDGVVDDTIYAQAAITYASSIGAELVFPVGVCRTTAPLNITQGLIIRGSHPIVKTTGMADDTSGGTWFYFDHLGQGFSLLNTNGYFTDTTFIDIGTKRNQPAPVSGWTPIDADYDIYCYGVADVTLRNVTMLNPTRGVFIGGNPTNGTGRLEIYNFKAQAMNTGILLDTTYDVTRLDQIHFWPFWQDDINVHLYTMANLDAIYSLRNDNPIMSNIFSIFARAGLRVGQGANGGTSKIHMVNADFDRGALGIWLDSSITTGCTGQFSNITTQGETGFAGSNGIFVEGIGSTLDFASYESGYSMQNAVSVTGTGNVLSFGTAKAISYDQQMAGLPAYAATTGNYITFATRPKAISGGVGAKFGLTGTLVVDEWRTFVPVVSSGTGTITTLSAVSGLYKLVGNTVYCQFDITITTNGSGGGDIRLALPFGVNINNFSGQGREAASTGKMLNIYVPNDVKMAIVYNYDNTYPAFNGARLVGNFQYNINVGI